MEESGIAGGHAQIFSAGGYRFLSISLQFEPLDGYLAWAQSIIDQNPGLPTILNTHSYLNPSSRQRQNTIQGNSGGVPNAGNTGEQVFQKFVFNNPQIFLTMNGQFSGEYNQTSINKAGQEVFELVMDYQSRANGGDGWMRMMQFRPGDNRIDVSTYSPTRNECGLDGDSRFSLPLNFLERFGAPEATGKSIFIFQNGKVVFGDSDGNRTTNLAELGRLRQSFNLTVGPPGTPASAASFDSDWNGFVTLADLGRLRQRFNQSLGF